MGYERVSPVGPRARWAEGGGILDAYFEFSERFDEFDLAARDDGDVGAAVSELARERESEPFGSTSDVAVLASSQK